MQQKDNYNTIRIRQLTVTKYSFATRYGGCVGLIVEAMRASVIVNECGVIVNGYVFGVIVNGQVLVSL